VTFRLIFVILECLTCGHRLKLSSMPSSGHCTECGHDGSVVMRVNPERRPMPAAFVTPIREEQRWNP
jgi:DNA-directed RNA polymerase subunit RPC12/RpoP